MSKDKLNDHTAMTNTNAKTKEVNMRKDFNITRTEKHCTCQGHANNTSNTINISINMSL